LSRKGLLPTTGFVAGDSVCFFGCHRSTIKWHNSGVRVVPRDDPGTAKASQDDRLHLDEKTFRWTHNEDAMAT